MGMYDYGQRGTYLNGFLNFIESNYPEITIVTYGDLNNHLKKIRLEMEPNKPISKSVEKNAFYIQENYEWKVVKQYFKKNLI